MRKLYFLLLLALACHVNAFASGPEKNDPPLYYSPAAIIQLVEDAEVEGELRSALDAVIGAGNYVMDAVDISDTDDGGKQVDAALDIWGENGIAVAATFSSGKRIQEFELEFPEEATIDLNNLNDLVEGKLTSYLPDGLPLDAGVSIKNFVIGFPDSGYLPSSLNTTLGVGADWDVLGNGSFTAEGLELEIGVEDPKSPQRVFSGTLSATASIGQIPVALSTTLSNNTEDIAIAASIENVNLKNVLDATVGDAASFLGQTPDLFKSLELAKAEMSLQPADRSMTFSSETSLGNMIFDVKRKPGSQAVLLALSPPPSFKFSELSPILSPMDGLDMSGSYFIVTDRQSLIPATFLNPDADENLEFPIKEGLNLVTSIAMPDNIQELLKVENIVLTGTMPPDFTGIDLNAELQFGLELGDGAVSFDALGVGLTLEKSNIEMRFEGLGSFQAGDSRVDIFGGLILDPLDQTIEFEAGLAAGGKRAEKPESCITPQAEWKEPFGIPGVGIRSLGMRAGLGAKFPWIATLGIDGNVRLGTSSDPSKHLCGAMTAFVNVADPTESMLIAEVNGLTPLRMIEAFSEAEINGALRDALDTGIEKGKLKIVPKEMTLFGRDYSPGIALDSLTLKLAGMEGLFGFSVGEEGISGYGALDPLIVEEGGFTFFAIQGARPDAQGNVTGPSVSFGLNATDPHFRLDGSVTVLEITNETFIQINKDGFEFETTGKILDGALGVTAHIKGGEITEDSGLYARVAFENKLQTMVADELIKFIEDSSKESQEAYRDAVATLEETKTGDDFTQFWVDAAKETVSAFQELDRGAAVVGAYVVEGLLKDALNIRKMSFEGEVTSMQAKVEIEIDMTIAGSDIKETVSASLSLSEEALVDLIVDVIGEDVVDFFGTLDTDIANAFEDLGSELETAFEDLGNEIVEVAEVVGEGVIDAAEYVGTAIIDAAEATEEWFMGSTATNTVSNGRFSAIPPGYTHFQVTVSNVVVTKDETDAAQDGLSAIGGVFGADKLADGLELFGGITVGVSSNIMTNEGATPYAYSRSARNSTSGIDIGKSLSVNHTKDFFVPTGQNGWVQVHSLLSEWNTVNTDTEPLSGSDAIQFNNLSQGQNLSGVVTGFNGSGKDEEVKINYSLRVVGQRGPIPTKDQMIAAVRSGNSNEINRLVSDGGSLRGSGMIEAAITGKANQSIIFDLLNAGNPAKTSQVVLASDSRYKNLVIVEALMDKGAYANGEALNNVVGRGEMDMAQFMVSRKAPVQLRHVQTAIGQKNRGMIMYLMSQTNIQVGAAELQYAIDEEDVEMANLFVKQGGTANAAMIAKAVSIGDAGLVNALLRVGEADASALQAAANTNNTELFKTLIRNQIRLVDNGPINTAIDQRNYEIVELGLRNGGSKASALSYAISKSDKTAMIIALDRGANATSALSYAAKDPSFFNDLLNKYGASANDAIVVAYDSNSVNLGEMALKAGASSNSRFAAAVRAKNNPWIDLLLKYNADPQGGMTAAIDNLDMPTTAKLIEAGAEAKDRTYIYKVAESGNLEFAKLLIERGGADAENGRNVAIGKNDVAMVGYLLEKGASPVGIAIPAQNGWLDMVKVLVEYGGNVNKGMEPAINANHTAVGLYLLDKGADVGEFIITTATKGNLDLTAKLIEKGADVQQATFPAARYQHVDIMKLLIDNNADVSREALMDAAVVNYQDAMVELLLANNGDTKLVTKKGETYLHRVSDKKGKTNLTQMFLATDIDIEALDKDGETALHRAVRSGKANAPSVKLLIDAGANVNALTSKGKTVWQRSNNKAAKELLTKAGAIKKKPKI